MLIVTDALKVNRALEKMKLNFKRMFHRIFYVRLGPDLAVGLPATGARGPETGQDLDLVPANVRGRGRGR